MDTIHIMLMLTLVLLLHLGILMLLQDPDHHVPVNLEQIIGLNHVLKFVSLKIPLDYLIQ